jgi:hypothetical protein
MFREIIATYWENHTENLQIVEEIMIFKDEAGTVFD